MFSDHPVQQVNKHPLFPIEHYTLALVSSHISHYRYSGTPRLTSDRRDTKFFNGSRVIDETTKTLDRFTIRVCFSSNELVRVSQI